MCLFCKVSWLFVFGIMHFSCTMTPMHCQNDTKHASQCKTFKLLTLNLHNTTCSERATSSQVPGYAAPCCVTQSHRKIFSAISSHHPAAAVSNDVCRTRPTWVYCQLCGPSSRHWTGCMLSSTVSWCSAPNANIPFISQQNTQWTRKNVAVHFWS